jgi:hypothetical protein
MVGHKNKQAYLWIASYNFQQAKRKNIPTESGLELDTDKLTFDGKIGCAEERMIENIPKIKIDSRNGGLKFHSDYELIMR